MNLRWWFWPTAALFLLLIFQCVHASPPTLRYVMVMKLYDRATGEPVSVPIPVRVNGVRLIFRDIYNCQKAAAEIGPIDAHAGYYVLLDCRQESVL